MAQPTWGRIRNWQDEVFGPGAGANASTLSVQGEPNFMAIGDMGSTPGPLVIPNARVPLPARGGSMPRPLPKTPVSPIQMPQAPAPQMEPRAVNTLAPIPKNSGLSLDAEDTNKARTMEQANTSTYLTPEQFAEMAKAAESLPGYQAQQGGIDRLSDLARMSVDQPVMVDLSPLMSLAEGYSGKKIAYKAPESQSDRQQKLIAYAAKLQDDRRDLFKNALEAIKAQKTGTLQSLAERIVADKVQQGAEDPAKFDRPARGGKGYDPTKDLQKLQKSMEPLVGIQTALGATRAAVEEAIGGPLANWTEKQDIPGVGATGWIPQAMLSDRGANIQQQWMKLKNAITYAESGKAITAEEAARLNAALGGSKLNKDRDMVIGIQNVERALSDMMRQKEAQIRAPHPEVIDLYRRGGGKTSEDMGTPKGYIPPPSKPARTPEQEKRLQELLKKAKGG